MQVLKRSIKPESYISFLYTYQTTWGTAGDICLVRETVAKSSGAKFVGRRIQLAIPKGMERDYVVNIPVIKIAGHVGEGHPKDPHSEWEAYDGIDPELATTVLKIWGFQLVEL